MKVTWICGGVLALSLFACEEKKATEGDGNAATTSAPTATSSTPEAKQTDPGEGEGGANAEAKAPNTTSPPAKKVAPAMIDETAAKEILTSMWVNDGDSKLAAEGTMKQQSGRDKLVHGGFRGTIGAYPDAVFLIGDDGKGLPNSPLPFVAVERDGKWLAHRLPQFPYMNTSVDAVFFEDLEMDGDTDVLVLGKFMTGIGPEGAQEFSSTIGYVWDKDHFAILDKVGDVAGTASTADEVREALEKKGLIK